MSFTTPARMYVIRWRLWAVAAVVVLVSACGSAGGEPTTSTSAPDPGTTPPVPALDQAAVAAGEALYGRYCAACHGVALEGQPNWQIPNADGSFPAPPHDSSGHTWHHADQQLVQIVRDGNLRPGSLMPAFGGQLTDEEILTILEFFKANWGPEERAVQWHITWQMSQIEQ